MRAGGGREGRLGLGKGFVISRARVAGPTPGLHRPHPNLILNCQPTSALAMGSAGWSRLGLVILPEALTKMVVRDGRNTAAFDETG